MLKVLIAHPDKNETGKIASFIKELSFDAVLAHTGKEAQKLISENKFYTTIMHLDIRNHSGYELLNYIKANCPSMRLILTCAENNIILKDDESLDSLFKLGILGLWRPPHDLEGLGKILDSSQNLTYILTKITRKEGQTAEENIDAKEADFTGIQIDDFFSGSVVLFDTFVKIGQDKFIKILHAGDSFTNERLLKYRAKTDILYLKTEDRRKYIKIMDVLLKKIAHRDDIEDATKLSLMKNMSQKYVEEITTFGLTPQLLDMGQGLVDSLIDTIRSSPNLTDSLKQMQQLDPSLYTHSYLVGLFSSLVAMQFEWLSPKTLQALAMASIFHDIGKLDLPKDIVGTDLINLSPENAQKYWDHPHMVSRKLADTKLVDSNVLQIIQQHHEYMDGSGFPKGLNGQKIHPLSRIIVVANDFCNHMVARQLSPYDTIKEMIQLPTTPSRYDRQTMLNLCQMFADPEKVKGLTARA